MTGTFWAILVPTIPRRAALFARLMERLLPQLEPYGGAVKVVGWLNVGQPRIAELRDAMLRHADEELRAAYVSFVDDDDLVTIAYVWRIMDMLAVQHQPGSLDHVGFRLECFKDGELKWPVEHNLRRPGWGAKRDPRTQQVSLFRDFTHLDPIRTEIARRGRFARAKAHQPEDRNWVQQVRPHLSASRSVFIDVVLYQYFWVPSLSAGTPEAPPHGNDAARPVIDSPHFVWHPESL